MSSLSRTYTLARAVARSGARKPFGQMAREAAALYRADGAFPTQYFKHDLYRREMAHPEAFAAYADHLLIDAVRRADPVRFVLRNKVVTHLHFRESGVAMPRMLGYNYQPRFFLGDEAREADGPDAVADVLRALLAQTETGLFVKPTEGSGGTRVLRLLPDASDEDVAGVAHVVRGGAFMFEEALRQHPALAAVYPHALNTLRILCLTLPGGEVRTLSALLRLGVGTSYVDNTSQGGIKAAIDLETGRLRGHALRVRGDARVEAHPDTGVAFEGLAVPLFAEARSLAEAALRHLPAAIVGWDVGVTPDGPVLIEGNGVADVRGSELGVGGFRHNPVFQAFVAALRAGWRPGLP